MNIIKKYGKSNYGVVFSAVSCVLWIVFGVYFLAIIADSHEVWGTAFVKIFGEYVEMDKESFMVLKVLAWALIIMAAVMGFSLFTILNNCLSICDDGITGTGFKFGNIGNGCFITDKFTIKYSDILNVNTKRKVLYIETATTTHKVAISDYKDAQKMLISKIKG